MKLFLSCNGNKQDSRELNIMLHIAYCSTPHGKAIWNKANQIPSSGLNIYYQLFSSEVVDDTAGNDTDISLPVV